MLAPRDEMGQVEVQASGIQGRRKWTVHLVSRGSWQEDKWCEAL